jgi:hypothetical protein
MASPVTFLFHLMAAATAPRSSQAMEKSFARGVSFARFSAHVFDALHCDHSNYAGLPQRLKASFVLEALFPSRVIAF